ncbi:hypothetical protein AB0F81_03125 [Actinoplanes sp. NPDC024001]|uniref:hypothetical protein n=1 Tax=Actinoplanes sp. NPDC024001 TaxID=3154598 RepID=UPI0033E7D70B
MRLLRGLLALAALILPPAHRPRWREEALALLAEVRGVRRWWFALDTVVKVPVLARQFREPVPPPGRWLSVLTGLGLLGASGAIALAVLAPAGLPEDAAEFLFLMAPCAMVGVVAVRSFWTARSYGGGPLAYLIALLISVFAGTGPVAAGALSVATGFHAIAVAGAFLPGLWLITVSGAALLRRTSPPALALMGVLCGIGLLGVLLGLQLWPASPLNGLSVILLVPAWTVWSVWTAARLIRARPQQRLV